MCLCMRMCGCVYVFVAVCVWLCVYVYVYALAIVYGSESGYACTYVYEHIYYKRFRGRIFIFNARKNERETQIKTK